jgi:phage gp16-like protein
MLAKIHLAKKTLQMEHDDYRQILLDETGKLSAGACSEPQLARVLDRLGKLGFTARAGKGAATHKMAKKARAMWISLHQLGVVHNPSEQALEAFAKRQLKCDRMVWANQRQSYQLIEALKAMAERAGWLQRDRIKHGSLTPLQLQSSLCQAILARLRDAGAVPAGWSLHDAAWKLCGIENAKEDPWTAEDYQRLAEGLGRHLRDAPGASIGEAA